MPYVVMVYMIDLQLRRSIIFDVMMDSEKSLLIQTKPQRLMMKLCNCLLTRCILIERYVLGHPLNYMISMSVMVVS